MDRRSRLCHTGPAAPRRRQASPAGVWRTVHGPDGATSEPARRNRPERSLRTDRSLAPDRPHEEESMTRVLLIKTSSMGDIVHNLPVVADIRRALPDATIDWVVEESYVELVGLATGLARILPVAQRRWRRSAPGGVRRDERRAFRDALRAERYDVVLDTQGLVKSALIARQARLAPNGVRAGFALGLVREGLARLFYDRGYPVDRRLHAIERMRALAAAALGYPPPDDRPRFLLDVPARRFPWIADGHGDASHERPGGVEPAGPVGPVGPPVRYAVLLHATARPEKAWPVEHWATLIDAFRAAGIVPVLPSGNAAERDAAERLAETSRTASNGSARPRIDAVAAPPLTLVDAAALLAGATAVVGVDTGLFHLAAALDVPTVGLFGATPRWRYAPYWSARSISLGGFGTLGAQPEADAVIDALERLGVVAPRAIAPPVADGRVARASREPG